MDLGQGAAGSAGVVFEGNNGALCGGVVDDFLGASPACLVVEGWCGTGEKTDDRRAERGGGVDVLAELQRRIRVVEEGGLRGVCDQQTGVSDAAGCFVQFGIEPGPCLSSQLQAVGAGLAGDVDKVPDGPFAALELVFQLHGGDQDRPVGGFCCARRV